MPKEKISDLDGLHKALTPVARDSAAVDSLLLTHRKMLEGAIKTIPKDNPGPMLPILKLLHGLPSVASVNAMIQLCKIKMAEFEFSKSLGADGRPILSASELARFANFLNDVPSQFRKILAQSAFKKSPFESPEAMILAMRECSEQWVRKEERRLPALRALLESYAEEDPDLLDSAMAEFEVTPSALKMAGGAATVTTSASAHPTVDSSLAVSAGAGSESAAKESEVLAATPADHLFVPPAKRASPNQENAARDYYHDRAAGREETLVGRKSLSPTEVKIEGDDNEEASHLPGGSMKKF